MVDRGLMLKIVRLYAKSDRIIPNINVLSLDHGDMQASYSPGEAFVAATRPLCAGLVHYLVDSLSTMSLLSHPIGNRFSVSTMIHLSVLDMSRIEQEIAFDVRCFKIDDKFARLQVTGISESSNNPILVALHTKRFGKGPFLEDPYAFLAQLERQ